jgi:hypothetical protein
VLTRRIVGRFCGVLAAPLLVAGTGVLTPSAVAAMRAAPAASAASLVVAGMFDGVAATSASNAWAVGVTKTTQPLIAHWNGGTWKQVPSPHAGANSILSAVAATSAGNAWAVGSNGLGKTLVMHWNGKA